MIVDSQTAKSTFIGDHRGYDSGKRLQGRKRHIAIDSLWLVWAVAVHAALHHWRPDIFNTDQGSQFTGRLASESIAISMDGKSRAIDNAMIERLWRSVKYENIYLKDYATGANCHQGLKAYLTYFLPRTPPPKSGEPAPPLARLPNPSPPTPLKTI